MQTCKLVQTRLMPASKKRKPAEGGTGLQTCKPVQTRLMPASKKRKPADVFICGSSFKAGEKVITGWL